MSDSSAATSKRPLEDASSASVPESKRARTQPSRTVKILVCGDVCGRFHRLFATAAQIDQRHGPFHMLFCVGKFFAQMATPASSPQSLSPQSSSPQSSSTMQGGVGEGAADSDVVVDDGGSGDLQQKQGQGPEDMQYITGEKPVPIPTFFIDSSSGNEFVESHPQGGELVKNITFLGRSGVMDLFGLKVAFLSGTMDPFVFASGSVPTVANYREQDIALLENTLEKHAGKIDMFLTAEWPAEILRQLQKDQLPKPPKFIDFKKLGSPAVKRLVKKCAPRYHFAAMEGAYWERAPYRTQMTESVGRKAITRFIALAPLSESKQKNEKFLYAAGLTPIADMTMEQLTKETPATTDSPFEPAQRRPKQHQSDQQQRRGVARDRPRTSQQVQSQSCWFCLSSPKVEKHLLVNIFENAYIAMPKGGLNEDHILIVPVKHTPHSLEADLSSQQEMAQYKSALRDMFAKEGKQMVVFERYVHLDRVPVHMHHQCVTLPSTVGQQQCQKAFEQEGKKNGLEQFQIFGSNVEMTKAIKDAGCEGHNYLAIELQDGSKMVSRITDTRKGVNFAREVLCQLLGRPDLADWRKCSKSQAEEKGLVQQMQKKFAPHAFDE